MGSALWDHSKLQNAHKDHQKIKVHFGFAVKNDGCHKARLVAEGHLMVETVYSGAVLLWSLRIVMLLSELHQLELWRTDIGNAYHKACTKWKLFIVAGPEIDELE